MTVRAARGAILECDGCHKEIKKGASTMTGRVMTFRSIDPRDGVAEFTQPKGDDKRDFHIWCLDPKAVEPEGYAFEDDE